MSDTVMAEFREGELPPDEDRRAPRSEAEIKEIIKCKKNPAYFINNYVWIQDLATQGAIRYTLWDAQETLVQEFWNNLYNIVLKARQLGITWLCLAFALWLMIFFKLQRVIGISKSEDDAMEMMDRFKFMFDRLPGYMKPATLKRGDTTFWLAKEVKDKRTGERRMVGQNSRFQVLATSKEAARSRIATLLIIDEAAFVDWLRSIWKAASSTLANTKGRCIILSTANGYNLYNKMFWRAAKGESNFAAHFLPWNAHPDRDEDWYKWKRRDFTTDEDMMEEFPKTPEEAFISSGRPVFNRGWVVDQIRLSRIPLFKGDLIWKSWVRTNEGVVPNVFAGVGLVPNEGGEFTMWRTPERFPRPQHYSIGVDSASGEVDREDSDVKHDFSCVDVWDRVRNEQVAQWWGKTDPYFLADVAFMIGVFYGGQNACQICFEVNNHGLAVLQRFTHPDTYIEWTSLYQREIMDKFSNEIKHNKPGFYTKPDTRRLLIEQGKAAISEVDKPPIINSNITLGQMLTFVRKSDGKEEHDTGQFDDAVFGWLLANHQSMEMAPPKKPLSEVSQGIYNRQKEKAVVHARKRHKGWVSL